ncbi:hypothetical protein Syun_007091 [Stephania yunnanensis]|uniref:Uncharacterized protein n=1 Tax=Stephania yunnanensis TaxID=152371 RepID=A0AAP0PZ38_9MAGN
MEIDGKEVKAQIWDMARQDRIRVVILCSIEALRYDLNYTVTNDGPNYELSSGCKRERSSPFTSTRHDAYNSSWYAQDPI